MSMTYNQYVGAVGRLIIKGIWLSDAIEIAHTVNGPVNMEPSLCERVGSEDFISDVDIFIDTKHERVPMPKYKALF